MESVIFVVVVEEYTVDKHLYVCLYVYVGIYIWTFISGHLMLNHRLLLHLYIFSWYFQEFSCTCVDEMIFGSGRYLSLWVETFNKIFSFPAQHFLFENHFLKQSCSEFNFHQFVCHITLNSLFNLPLYQYIVRYTVQALGPMIPRKRHSPVSMLAV